jgi:hypothetical protein
MEAERDDLDLEGRRPADQAPLLLCAKLNASSVSFIVDPG